MKRLPQTVHGHIHNLKHNAEENMSHRLYERVNMYLEVLQFNLIPQNAYAEMFDDMMQERGFRHK